VKKNIYQYLSLVLFVLLLTVGGVLLYSQRTTLFSRDKNAPDPAVSHIRSFMDTPQETPQIASLDTVEEFKKKDPEFFKNAAVGDKIISYPYMRILYSPKTKKIVNIVTLPTPLPTPSQPIRIMMRYNADELARAKTLKSQLEQASPNLIVLGVEKSSVVYTGDIIYLVNPAKKDDALRFSQMVGGSKIVETPEKGEEPTEADVILAFRDIQ